MFQLAGIETWEGSLEVAKIWMAKKSLVLISILPLPIWKILGSLSLLTLTIFLLHFNITSLGSPLPTLLLRFLT